MSAPEMIRGLGLAEGTPGPLIMVTEYVGFVAAWKTCLPAFLLNCLGAPYSEWLSTNRRL